MQSLSYGNVLIGVPSALHTNENWQQKKKIPVSHRKVNQCENDPLMSDVNVWFTSDFSHDADAVKKLETRDEPS